MRTERQVRGDAAEAIVADRLTRAGWRVLGRQVRVGRAEIDVLGVDSGPPARLVAVEVRWRSRRDFGLPEESVDRAKVRRLRHALWALRESGHLADGTGIPPLPVHVDIVALEPGPSAGTHRFRHHRSVG